jgi:HK97 family phage major capsid protein
MNPEQLRAMIATIASDAKPLTEKSKAGTLTAEEDQRYDELVSQLNKAIADLAKAEERAATNDMVDSTIEKFTKPAPAQRQIANGTEPDLRSLGAKFADSAELKDFRQNPHGTSKKFHTESILHEKALIFSGTASASTLLPQVMPGIRRGLEPISAVRQALGSGRTSSDSVVVLQELVFTNAAAEVDESIAVDDASAVKPESAITFEEVAHPVRIVAHWIPITRQMLEDLPMMESYVEGRLRDGLERRVSAQLINGNGTAPNISGLLDQTGLTVADAAYFAGAPVNDAGTDNENLNRIRRAKRLVRTTGLATPTFILANPADTEDWDTITTTTGEYLVGDPSPGASVARLWGLPVLEDENIAAGTVIVGDGTQAAVIDRNDAAIYMADQHADFFIRNIFVMLAEVRLTLVVFRPAAFVVTTMA